MSATKRRLPHFAPQVFSETAFQSSIQHYRFNCLRGLHQWGYMMRLYRIEGRGKESKRRRKREYEAPDEATARQMADYDGTVVEIVCDLGDMKAVQAQWAEEGMKRILRRDLARFGFDDEMWDASKATIDGQFECPANAEQIVREVHRTLLASYSSPESLADIYMHIGGFLRDCDKDSRPAMREFYRQEILCWKESGVVRGVKVLAAAGCCQNCRAQNGLVMTLDEALVAQPLPCATCTSKHFEDKGSYPWCRCGLVAVLSECSIDE